MAKNTAGWSWRNFVNLMAFVAMVCIGISLVLSKIGSISGAFKTVADVIAYSLTAISAFFYAYYKRHWAYYIVWIVCVALIVILMIL